MSDENGGRGDSEKETVGRRTVCLRRACEERGASIGLVFPLGYVISRTRSVGVHSGSERLITMQTKRKSS